MKDSLLLPVIFLVLLVVCSVLLALGYLMYLWDTQYVPTSVPNLKWAVAAAPQAVRTVYIPAVLLAFFLAIMRIARRPGVAFFSFLFSLAMLFAALHYGVSAVGRFAASEKANLTRSYNPLLPGRFNILGRGVIYPWEVSGNRLGPTLVVTPKAKTAFTFEPKGSFDPASSTLAFAQPKLTLPVVPANPNFTPVFEPRGFLTGLITEMKGFSAYLEKANRESRVDFAVALGGVTLFCVGCIGFAWVTRWPLLNVFFVAILFRLLFWLFSLFTNTVATKAFALVVPSHYMPLAPSIGLGALGVIFLLWDILFIRPPSRD